MNELWSTVAHYAWVPSTALGVLGGLWGALAGTLGPLGRARSVVVGAGWVLIGVCVLMLVLGLVALTTGQPYAIWYGLLLPGVIGGIVLGSLMP